MICKKCAHESYCDTAQFCIHEPPITITACSKFKEKSQTKAERIRAMSDEELAFWLYCRIEERSRKTIDQWLEWLREEIV